MFSSVKMNNCYLLPQPVFIQFSYCLMDKLFRWFVYFYKFRDKLSVPLTVVTIFSFVWCTIKQLLDSVFVIIRIIKVEVGIISRSRRPWLLWILLKPHPMTVHNWGPLKLRALYRSMARRLLISGTMTSYLMTRRCFNVCWVLKERRFKTKVPKMVNLMNHLLV